MTAELEHLTYGYLVLVGPGVYNKTRVQILGRLKTLIRIRALTRTQLGGQNNWLEPGEEANVPRVILEHEDGRDLGPRDIPPL